MFLIDTSVWINVFRDRTGAVRQSLEVIINNESIFLSRFTQMELLQGCR
ncbi:MAG TPA: VapC toxin family PIN domain ribonuclease, partial [Planktothrix sp. UBA8407]|nr:VapC toxin family PIN domain ribonuclease [Planktothrix sp. UBA8407]HBK23241.1 VapC toxin family PIN domain ribonuclease [Planktothrix sp. UBA10369]